MMVQAAADIAHRVIDNMKGHPLALALIVINVLFIALATYLLYSVVQAGIRRDELLRELSSNCFIAPAPKGDRK